MALLNKQQIFDAQDHEFKEVAVPEWGGDVRLRSLTGAERDKYESSLARMGKNGQMIPDMVNARARLVALTAVDENGNRVFTDQDVLKLGTKSSKALDRLFEQSSQLSGISEQDMEKMVEGFDNDQSESSTSD